MVANVINVSTAAQLQTALASATGGETILLATGNYGSLGLIAGHTKFDVTHSAAAPVTIRSADAGQPAVFTGLDLRGASGYTFENLTFDYTYKSTDPIWISPFNVTSSSDITIRGSTFDGDVAVNRNATDNGLGFGSGFGARFTTNLVFENNTITNFHRAAGFGDSTNVVIRGNDIHSIRMDGLTLSGMQGVRIENNHIHDFKRAVNSGDHADMIQFWTSGSTRPSTDIVIRNNLLDIGNGQETHSIFMRNELVDTGAAGAEMFYRNVLIEQNTIYNDHLHGISLGEATGVVIRNNAVLHADGNREGPTSTVSIPSIGVAAASTGVIIAENVVARIGTGLQGYGTPPASWAVTNNLLVQDQDESAANHYSTLFVSTTLNDRDGSNDYLAIPGGVIDRMGLGPDRILIDRTPEDVRPLFHVATLPADGDVYVFDAVSLTFGPGGAIGPGQGRFVWDFGDGTYASGGLVQHRYATPGDYAVTLMLVRPDGSTTAFSDRVVKTPDDLVRFDGLTGQFGIVTDSGETMLAPRAGTVVDVGGAKMIDLGGAGVTTAVPVRMIEGLFGADNFEIDLQIRGELTANNWGEVFRLQNTFSGAVTRNGDFWFNLRTDGGPTINLTSQGVKLNDGRTHDISIRYDADAGTIRMIVDGQFATEAPLTANLPKMGVWDLMFGSSWGGQNFNGMLSHFDLNVERSDYAEYAGTMSPVPSTAAAISAADWLGLEEPTVLFDRFVLDDAAMLALRADQLWGSSLRQTVGDDTMLTLGGRGSEVRLGVIDSFRDADQIAFTLDFKRASPDTLSSSLVMNNGQIDLSLVGDGLRVQVATATEGFKRYDITNLGLRDTDWHEAVVLFDPVADRLRVFLDDQLVLEDNSTDLVMVNPQGAARDGWILGRNFTGTIAEFDLSENINHPFVTGDLPLFA